MLVDHEEGWFVDLCCQLVQRVNLIAGHLAGRTFCTLKTCCNGETFRGGRASNTHDNNSIVDTLWCAGIADGFEAVTQLLGRLPNKLNSLFR